MIAANKRLIKANLSQGVVGIQGNLISLYQSNLNAVSVTAALIAGLAFQAVAAAPSGNSISEQVLSYFYYLFFTISFVTSLWAVSQATISTMFGPSLALKGESEDSVKVASDHMRTQQGLVFTIGIVSITTLFLGSMVLTWTLYPIGVSVITTVAYVAIYYLLLKTGVEAYNTFVPAVDVTLDNPAGEGADSPNSGYVVVKNADGTETRQPVEANPNDPHELKKTKYKGVIWQRTAAEEGGQFFKCYGTLKDGRLDFYRTEQDYLDHQNPINKKPFKMWQFNVETDSRKFARQVTSLRNAVKAAVLGGDGQDFSVGDLFSSEYDLPYAAKHYRFALMPKISSELQSVDNLELLAHDEQLYKEWVKALRTVANAYDEIAAMPTVNQTMRMGRADVEVVVQAANV